MVAFPPDLTVELWIGGAWVDITGDVRTSQDIVITRGRRDQSAYTDPGRCTLRLNNRNGHYSPRNPRSPLFGLIGRNTPIRVRVGDVPADTELLTDSFARTVASGWGSADTGQPWTTWTSMGAVTGDYEVSGGAGRMDVSTLFPDGWAATTDVGSADVDLTFSAEASTAAASTTAQGSILAAALLRADPVAGTGYLLFVRMITDTGLPDGQGRRVATSITRLDGGTFKDLSLVQTVPGLTYTENTPLLVRAQAIGPELRIKTWADGQPEPAAWHTQQYDTTYADGEMGLYAGAALLDTGTLPFTVAFRDLAIRQPAPDTGVVRFVGEVSEWPPSWDLSGADHWVAIEASGVLRRLTRGTDPLQSVMRRHIPTQWPLAYWPLEEGRLGDTTAASAVANTGPLAVSGLDFAQDTSLVGSGPLPTVSGEARLASPPIPGVDTGSWAVILPYLLPDDSFPTAETEILTFTTSAGYRVRVTTGNLSGADRVRTTVTDSDGTTLATWTTSTAGAAVSFTGQWRMLRVRAWQSGTTVNMRTDWATPTGAGWGFTTPFTGTAGRVTGIDTTLGAALKGMSLGHLSVWGVYTETGYLYYGLPLMDGMAPQSARNYVQRLAAEADVALDGYGEGTTAIGPQPADAWITLVQDAVATNMAVLSEQRRGLGLTMRSRDRLYNQVPLVTLDYSAGLISSLQPTEDDQGIHNEITVRQVGGSEYTAVLEDGPMSVQAPPGGIGRYPHQVDVNLWSASGLADQAGWRLRLSTVDELRYPEVGLNLANPRMAPYIDALLLADSGDVIRITDLPDTLPPGDVDLMVQGYSETLGAARWEITLVCTPASPWTVAVVDDDILGRADTDGSELAAAVDAEDTSLQVAVTAGPLWVTDPAELPLDIRVGGEVMTVTAITGTASPQTFTVVRSVNGIAKAHGAGADVRLAQPAIVSI